MHWLLVAAFILPPVGKDAATVDKWQVEFYDLRTCIETGRHLDAGQPNRLFWLCIPNSVRESTK